ncbi:hypothetical protein Pan153_39070 [Gimesia panareensis]|uniref:Probable inorganic carbon transporter subunit DabA n=1 Tax=Gimesia panareensis TaxID=2527978 RepID=A0A518FSB8_9PLAN|nr:DUF2309 domain-containing protein [Gimesia panareensis]QDV19242.1 hypothetical protein Pan153_39070 [Gimesia panareensis]
MNKSTEHMTGDQPGVSIDSEEYADLIHAITHAAHFLPAQGPITVFVHHNTLHAFENRSFENGVFEGGRIFGCHPYLSEERYRKKLESQRIGIQDLQAVLQDELADNADQLIGTFGTRYALRLAMLEFPLYSGPVAELRWFIAETDALRRFRQEVSLSTREQTIAKTQQWIMRDFRNGKYKADSKTEAIMNSVFCQFDRNSMDSWDDQKWESFALHFLWQVCHNNAQAANVKAAQPTQKSIRHRDILHIATGVDSDLIVNDVLIRFCAAFLDQGFGAWTLPARETGFFHAFLNLYSGSKLSPSVSLTGLNQEIDRLIESKLSPLESISESLSLLGVTDEERDEYITQTLLALRGWSGIVWQMESNAEWAPHPAPAGSLIEFLAVRLILDRLALATVMQESLNFEGTLATVRNEILQNSLPSRKDHNYQLAFTLFQLSQVRGWNPEDLVHLSDEQWTLLIQEIELFSSLERRRVFHLAYERKYRNDVLNAVTSHTNRYREQQAQANYRKPIPPSYQVVCCIDEREESFRRHLEEIAPDCQTFGIAGFFGVAMYYRGAADAHFTPLCPVNIKPIHYVQEETLYSLARISRRRAATRQRLGRATHQTHVGTRTFIGGFLTGLVGSLAAFPLVARTLFPRTTAQIRSMFQSIVAPPTTQLRLERISAEPGANEDQLGYSIEEMAQIVEGGLRAMGLAQPELFSPLVIICGHGSSSLNNPHEAAHDCGACGGGRGGPNARAFAQMANDPRVRRILSEHNLFIPDKTIFLGCYHNTCNDNITWYDLDRLPVSHRKLFETADKHISAARAHNAHERCRRFESADLEISVNEALRHVEGRAEDLSQVRPEYGHATNSICFVGRREWSRGLFLDRRAFLTSYDPLQDDENSTILERLLQAVIPVCAGINLEYYFSYVDSTGYGCGTKLAHNITSLLGVMDGAASDLRPGLPWQMVEIHEPVRLLLVIETTKEAIVRIINNNPNIARLVNGNWVQLAILDVETSQIQVYRNDAFELYRPETENLPSINSSIDWYRGRREHLGFASIDNHTSSSLNQVSVP